jgi:hypothetical protein
MITYLCVLIFLSLGPIALAQEDALKRLEVGAQYSLLRIPSSRVGCGGCLFNNSGFGGRFVANFSPAVALDSEVDFFPDQGAGGSNLEGGRVLTAFFGVKAGYRTERFGLYAKLRPGIQSYGRVITGLLSTQPLEFSYTRRNNFALDLGGVVEMYPTSALAVRFDVGDTRIRFGTGSGYFWKNNLQVSTGILFRF